MFGIETVRQRESNLVGIGEQIGLVEADDLVKVLADASNIFVSGARLDDMLDFVSEPTLAVEDAGEGGSDEVKLKLAGAAHQSGGEDPLKAVLSWPLALAIESFVHRETGNQVEVAQLQRGGDLGREVHAAIQEAGLIAAHQLVV